MSVLPVFAVSAVLVGLGHGLAANAQRGESTPANPAFDVISVKRNVSGSGSMRVGVQPGGRYVAVNTTTLNLVQNAYPFEDFRIVNAPGWTTAVRYDVKADAEGELTREELRTREQELRRPLEG